MEENKHISILLVEDDPTIRELCHFKIQENFINYFKQVVIVECSDALEGYRKARKEKFDLIWTDYHMPKIMGNEFILALREVKENSSTPILIFTGLNEEAKKYCKVDYLIEIASKEDGIDHALNQIHHLYNLRHKLRFGNGEGNKLIDRIIKKFETTCTDETILKQFILKSENVFKNMCGVSSLEIKEICNLIKDECFKNVDIVSQLPLFSEKINGTFYLGFSKETFLNIIELHLGEKFPEISSTCCDAFSEITNIIFGNVKLALENQYNFQISSPSIIFGKRVQFLKYNQNLTLVSMKTNLGTIYLGLSPQVSDKVIKNLLIR